MMTAPRCSRLHGRTANDMNLPTVVAPYPPFVIFDFTSFLLFFFGTFDIYVRSQSFFLSDGTKNVQIFLAFVVFVMEISLPNLIDLTSNTFCSLIELKLTFISIAKFPKVKIGDSV